MKNKIPLNEVPGCHDGRSGLADGGLLGVANATPTPDKPHSGLRTLRRFGPLVVIAAVMGLVFVMGWHREVTLEDIVALRGRLHMVLAQHQVASVLVYVVAYVLAVALSVPCSLILTLTGGLLFGTLVGGVAAVVGATLGATLLFLMARSALGRALSAGAAPWLTRLREGFKDHALSYLLFLRLVPAFPFWFVNIAPAVLGVPLKTYVIGTFFGIIPATFAFASAGAGLDSVIAAAKAEYAQCMAANGAEACNLMIHASSLVTRELLLALLLLGVVALIPVALRRWRNNHAAAK